MRRPWKLTIGAPGPHQRVVQLPFVLWLAVIWTLLWGEFTAANLVVGLLVGVLVSLLFPLPALDIGMRLHPLGLLRLVLRFTADLVKSTLRVTRQILLPGQLGSAMLALPIRAGSDLLMTALTVVVSAMPGSTVVEVRRETFTLFLHVLGVFDEASMERARQDVRNQEARVVRALGTPEQIARLERGGAG
ncbi:Na+/H+ antiporter subunit E [Streptomyces sp. TP-A0874]|uniref:Na+/H+ antiporter subunit E n=1 Tax=Streptomyces sp. TP-A0874 TaxID=549819 RepID=UPI00085292EA|nr:Na+/H+ antiporter subunit E [Streptomyces sp. TP-A0874]